MHSSIACAKYGRHVQMSDPNTSLPLHSSCTRTVNGTDSSGIVAGSPHMYIVRPPMGGKKSLMSVRVSSSEYIILVCGVRGKVGEKERERGQGQATVLVPT